MTVDSMLRRARVVLLSLAVPALVGVLMAPPPALSGGDEDEHTPPSAGPPGPWEGPGGWPGSRSRGPWRVVLYFALADVRSELGTVLILIGAWQVLFYVAWRGWPFSAIERRPLRLTCAHVVVIASGVLTYFLAHEVLGVGPEPLAAFAGCFVAAGLLFGMLFEGWLDRVATVVAALALAALLALTLHAIAEGLSFTRASADEWVTHVGLNAIGVSIILHVGIGRRWPFETARDREGSAAAPARREGQPGVA